MSFIYGDSREQVTLSTLEDGIASDNAVRLIDLIVDKLYQEDSSKYTLKGNKETGRPAYHPRHMLKLFVYGYMNRIPSSRRLEAECKRNLELKWLLNNLCPDFKTIADFRKDNGDAVREMSLKFRFMLSNQGLITGELMALDGTKLKANAGSKEVSYDDLASSLKDLDAEIERYLSLLNRNDVQDDLEEINAASLDTVDLIRAKIGELQAKQRELQDLQSKAAQSSRRKINPTDPDSRMIVGHKEQFSGYNLQLIVDAAFKLIAAAQVRQTTNDRQELLPALEDLKESLDIEPQTIVADKGYDNVAQLQQIDAAGRTEAIVSCNDEPRSSAGFGKWAFRYDEAKDRYYCPLGKELKPRGGVQKRKDRFAVVYQCKKSVCQSCEHRSRCASGKEGRIVTRYTDEKWVEAYRNKLQRPREQALLRRRKAIVEHVFGVLKCWMGKIPLLLRGRDNVQTEIELYATAYNLKRLIKLLGFDGVKALIMAQWDDNRGFVAVFSAILFPKEPRWGNSRYQNQVLGD